MNFLSCIESKRSGELLSSKQIQAIVAAYTAGKIPDYQMAAFLMAVFFRGLNRDETTALTLAMRDSGDVLKFPKDERPIVDKHSTGGIGDKISLPLTPLLACLGFRVPMISGRGLGITGGTLDKLDSIPGFQTLLSTRRIIKIVQQIGGVICGQTERMVPADKKIYALRDATGTVPNLSLITASILSKKLAEQLDALILDVKFGSAAFMPTQAAARQLARAMVALGRQCGVNTRAILTDMNTPIGRSAGNWLEVRESVACLDGQGPADLRLLVLTCAAHLLMQTGRVKTLSRAMRQAESCLDSGAPRRKWDEMLRAQGADLKAFERKLERQSTARIQCVLQSPRAGYVTQCDARIIGEVVRDLGGGRQTQEASINHEVGIDQLAKPGERVEKNGALCRVHAASQRSAEAALTRLPAAFQLAVQRVQPPPLIGETIR
ncbi:MAG: thymidine phosphorylase [Verrucomicrobiae bacterium]|nr:thymidine phosphorylase [Verrucomicrobiae bacterium]